jgi:hypothetical protein
MRLLSLFLSVLFLCSVMVAQKRYVVSPNDEVIPLRRGESPASVIARKTGRSASSTAAVCGDRFHFGYPEDKFPATVNFGATHKDVMGEWFVSKATGTIDTLFWEVLGSVGAKDSTVYVRIHNSRIGPNYGPGIYNDSSSWKAPCQNWGYFINTNDLDQGVAAFPEDATPTGLSTWTSTIAAGPVTKPPFTENIWGFTGYGVTDHAGEINSLALLDGGANLDVVTGQQFFISQRVKGPDTHTIDARTEWAAAGFHVDKSDESYPSRDWKFYEHDSGPSNCAGIPTTQVKRGWVARGGFGEDSLDVALFNYWYSIVVTTNVPPDVQYTTIIHTTFSSALQTVDAEILDCDPALPARAGVKKAILKWQINDVPQADIDMFSVGGLTWECDLPGAAVGSTVGYKVYAEDSTGLFAYGAPHNYRIVEASNGYVRIDTSGSCVNKSIAGNPANVISPSSFYIPPGSATNAVALDDGSSGPFDMGSNMPLFGDVGRYMWIGVNGGLAISKSATDTVDVNSGGLFSAWSFPYGNNRRGGRSDTANGLGATRMPGNFFAPAWGDLWHGDSVGGNVCGHIRFQRGFGGDTCLIIAEWDSVGAFSLVGGPGCDEYTFRTIFNKCDGSVEYQYDNIGTTGQDTSVIIGFQADSSALTVPNPVLNNQQAYIFLNENGYPEGTRPRAGWCVKFYQSTVATALSGWNLLSVGVVPIGGDYSKPNLYPKATTAAFAYTGTYVQKAILQNGAGYWMKFTAGQNIGAPGGLLHDAVDTIRVGWNLVGTIGFPVSTSSIVQGGGVALSSAFYDYNGTYHTQTTLKPGFGFWVKASAPGTLTINGGVPAAEPKNTPSTNFASLNSITITDHAGRYQTLYLGAESSVKEALSFYELPPAAPEFDARYSSERMVETYPAKLDEKAVYEYPVNITTDAYPVTISWNTVSVPERKIVLTSADGKLGKTVLDGSGRVKISDANVKSVVITLANVDLPKVYALGQNYPNPFNPTTTFNVDIPRVSDVNIKIYDVLGREISTLMSGQQPAGSLQVKWDGRDAHGLSAPTGIYFVRMAADDFTTTRKIMLMK